MFTCVQPEQTPKRPLAEDGVDEEDGPDPRKKPKQDVADSRKTARLLSHAEPQITDEERQKILDYVEQDNVDGDVLDESELRRMILLFEKRNLRNQEMRIKFPQNPEKFMDSEIVLHETIEQLKLVATVPDLYPLFVELRTIPSLLELLAHQNTGICASHLINSVLIFRLCFVFQILALASSICYKN